MNEIIRIHIAKIPYDIEISAKHEIEKYFKELENYASDNELMQDIEIRITELLTIRGITANGVIGSDDVEAIKKQLGEPKDFRSEESTEDFENNQNDIPKKKLYRDKEGAILGGVLSGLANYFNIDPILMRLGFIVLFLLSGGSLLLLYILFWLIIPPARTAIEKIQMTGRVVNLDSIREFNEAEAEQTNRYQRAESARKIVGVLFGCMFLAIAVSIMMFTILISIRISTDSQTLPIAQIGNGWGMLIAFILAIISGLLLSLLFGVFSYACFVRKFNSKIGLSIASIIALGIITFGSAVGIAMYNNNPIIYNSKKIEMSVPDNFSKINSLELNIGASSIQYIVSEELGIGLITNSEKHQPKIAIKENVAIISYSDDVKFNETTSDQITLIIHGPALNSIINNGGVLSYDAEQQNLSVIISGSNSVLVLSSGTFENLSIDSTDDSSVNAMNITANNVTINQRLNSTIQLGKVKTLKVTQPQTCPSYANTTTEVRGVLSGNIIYNNHSIGVEERGLECGSILIK